jgi:isocitrate dehydrogenase
MLKRTEGLFSDYFYENDDDAFRENQFNFVKNLDDQSQRCSPRSLLPSSFFVASET